MSQLARQQTYLMTFPFNKMATKRIRTKRITVKQIEIDLIREKIQEETGVNMTYVQTFDFLIHFYMRHCNEPKTRWVGLK